MTAAHVTKSIAHHAQRAVFLAILLCLAIALAAPVQAAGDDDGWSGTRKDNDVAAAEKKIAAEDFAGAIPLLEKATRTNPRNANAFNLLAFSQRNLGDYESAAGNYKTALFIDPDHKGALEYQGELFLALDQPERAEANLARLDDICFFECRAYVELKQAIDDYRAKHGS